MASGINEATDKLFLNSVGAWHGLGLVVAEDLPPVEAYKRSGIDVVAEKVPIYDEDGNVIEGYSRIRRQGTKKTYQIANDTYTVLQYSQVCELAQTLSKCDECPVVETLGTLEDTSRFWILLRGKDIDMGGDSTKPYLCIATSHDGTLSLQLMPTAVRVVCRNTLGRVLGQKGNRYTWKHSEKMELRHDEVKKVIAKWQTGILAIKTEADRMAGIVKFNRKQLEEIWTAVYVSVFGEIPSVTDGESKHKTNKRDRATEFLKNCTEVFDAEIELGCGVNLWTASQAFAGVVEKRADNGRITSADFAADKRLFGTTATELSKTYDAFREASAQILTAV